MTGEEPRLKALMIRGLDGDGSAHGQLLSAMSGFLRAYFFRRLGPASADAEDLVQETLLAIHLKRDAYDHRQPFTPWAYAVARYKLLDHFRRLRTRHTVPIDDAGDLFTQENPEEGAVRHDIAKLLSSLSPRQRSLLTDVKLAGLSMGEAARRGDMSVTAAKVGVHRSMKRLARKVGDEHR